MILPGYRGPIRERPRRFGIDRCFAFGDRDGLPRPYAGSLNPCRGAEHKLPRSEQTPSKSNGSAFAAPSTPRSSGRTNLKRPFSVEDDGEKVVDPPRRGLSSLEEALGPKEYRPCLGSLQRFLRLFEPQSNHRLKPRVGRLAVLRDDSPLLPPVAQRLRREQA